MIKKTRFAPSPSGFLHIGGARTALLAWLWTKNMGGKFVLRIEDTDQNRSTNSSADSIIKSLKTLGIIWDEGPGLPNGESYYQSNRLKIYKNTARMLMDSGAAYPCFCSKEKVERAKAYQKTNKKHPMYDGTCRNISKTSAAKLMKTKDYCIRIKNVFSGPIKIKDKVVGKVEFPSSNFDDFVIVRSNGFPMYNFACVIDDSIMGITHVVRGNEHLPNTPRQLIIYNALNKTIPKFAHLPIILDPATKKKMSKRNDGVSVEEFIGSGVDPKSIVLYLAKLGNKSTKLKDFSVKGLINRFNISSIKKTPVFHNAKSLFKMDKLVKASYSRLD